VTLLLSYDGSILVIASNGALVAYNAQSGQSIWQVKVSKYRACHFAMLEHNGLLYVGNEGFVFAYHMINGLKKWENGLSGFRYDPISLAAYAFAPPGGVIYDILFVGTRGYVLALDGQTGTTRQHIDLDGAGYKPVALLLDPITSTLYTGTSGEVRCYRADNMTETWKSNLPGMGYSLGHSIMFGDHATIFAGMNGKVTSLDRFSSKTEWLVQLPGSGGHLVTVASTTNPDLIVCGSRGSLYGINKRGRLVWQDDLHGLGYSPMCISTTTFDTDFNTTTLLQHIEIARR